MRVLLRISAFATVFIVAFAARIRNRVSMSSGNTFGRLFKVTTFGESHGRYVGAVVDGCPPRIKICENDIQLELNRRKPGQSSITTPRDEDDQVEIVSGVHDGSTTGAPICFLVKNKDQRSSDYDELNLKYRPSHADATYDAKYGIRSIAGGGRSSARETIGRVCAGALAKKILQIYSNIEFIAYVKTVANISTDISIESVSKESVEASIVRCPDKAIAQTMIDLIEATRKEGNSLGGIIELVIKNVPAGLGSPVFDKLEADIAKAVMSIPATKGVEIGSGFFGTTLTGRDHNDEFYIGESKRLRTKTNRSGGIQGGISNGENIIVKVAFKPTSTISLTQKTVTREGEETTLKMRGRHDPCVLPRAVPIVESMAALVVLDALLLHKGQCSVFN